MFYRKCRFLQKHRIRRSQEREGAPREGQGQSCRVLSTAPTWFGVQGFQLGQLLHLHLLGQVPCGTQGDSSALSPAAGTLGGGTLPLGTPSLPLSSPRAIPAPLPAGICAKNPAPHAQDLLGFPGTKCSIITAGFSLCLSPLSVSCPGRASPLLEAAGQQFLLPTPAPAPAHGHSQGCSQQMPARAAPCSLQLLCQPQGARAELTWDPELTWHPELT